MSDIEVDADGNLAPAEQNLRKVLRKAAADLRVDIREIVNNAYRLADNDEAREMLGRFQDEINEEQRRHQVVDERLEALRKPDVLFGGYPLVYGRERVRATDGAGTLTDRRSPVIIFEDDE